MHKFRNSCLLILTALIWGIAFVAQSEGGDAVGAYTFNSIRSVIGGIVLIPVILMFSRKKNKADIREDKKFLVLGGLCCGVVLFISSTLQQVGITMGTSAGKAGFLTACYIVLVPIFGIFIKRRCGLNVWVSVVLAIVGLYFLCINGAIALQTGDILLILGAFGYAVAYFNRRLFFTEGGRYQDVMHTASILWITWHSADVFCGYEAQCCRYCEMGTVAGFMECMDSTFICRCTFCRCWLYFADYWSGRFKSNGGIIADEPGICLFCACRMDYPRTKTKWQRIIWLRTYICGCCTCPDRCNTACQSM